MYSIIAYLTGQTEGATLSQLLGRSPVQSFEFMRIGEHVIERDVYEVKEEDFAVEVHLIYALAHLFPRIRYSVRKDLDLIEGPGPLRDSSLYCNYRLSDKWSVKDELHQVYGRGLGGYYAMDIRCNLDVVFTSLAGTQFRAMAQEAMYLEQDIRIHEEKAEDTNPLVTFYQWLKPRREEIKRRFVPDNRIDNQKLIVMTAVLWLCKEHLDANEEQYNG